MKMLKPSIYIEYNIFIFIKYKKIRNLKIHKL